MADLLEQALILAEIVELQKQQSEANIEAIYLGATSDRLTARLGRAERIAELRRLLGASDA